MASNSTDGALLSLRHRECAFILLNSLHERRSLLRVVSVAFLVLGGIAAGFLWDTAPVYALAVAVPLAGCLAWDVRIGVVMRRIIAGVPEPQTTHATDPWPLPHPSDELPLYPLLLAGGCAAGLVVCFVMLARL